MEFLLPLKETALARWVSESGSLLGFPTFLFLHTIGLATVAGLSAVINLRVLGAAPAIPLASLSRLFPAMWVAFGVTAASGLTLLITDIVTKTATPVFWVKMLLVALALVCVQMLKTVVHASPSEAVSGAAKILAAATFLLWVGATTAGRLMAYLGPAGGL